MYASYWSNNATISRIVIFSSDTDVIVIACYHYNHLLQNCSEVWIRTSHAKKSQFIPIYRIFTTLGEKICRVLPSFHCLTGCDSTRSFSGIGKKKSFKVLSENIDKLGTLDQLGEKPTLEKESDGVRDAIKLVCLFYDSKCQVFDINQCKKSNYSCRKSNLVCAEACLGDNCENLVGNCESDSESEND